MCDEEAERVFIRLRWSDNDGERLLPALRLPDRLCLPPAERRAALALQSLPQGFQVTSGTLFAFHKLPLRAYLIAIAIFCNEVKGKSMLAMSPRSRRAVQNELCSRAQNAGKRWRRKFARPRSAAKANARRSTAAILAAT